MSEKSKRLMMIYSRLKSGPVTIDMLQYWAQKNNVPISTRTFYRDLYDLENSVIPRNEKLIVVVGEKNRKTWKLEYVNQEEALTEFDINSYILFQNFLPLSIISSRQDSLGKIGRLFYQKNSKSQFEHFVNMAKLQIKSSHFHEGTVYLDYHKILDDCIWSIQNKRKMKLISVSYDYTSLSKNVVFPQTFYPVQILYHRGVVHVSGFLKDYGQLIVLGLDQIAKYKLTNDPFENNDYVNKLEIALAKRFGITQNINEEIYDIEIEFSERTGTFVSKLFWHETQKFEKLENGNFLMIMKCGLNRKLIGWLFQWMSNVKVLKPNLLKDLVIEKHKEIIQLYEEDKLLVSNNSYRPT